MFETAPNYRRAECCNHCKHFSDKSDQRETWLTCTLHSCFNGSNQKIIMNVVVYGICDDFEWHVIE